MKLKYFSILLALLLASSCGEDERNKIIVSEGETASSITSADAVTKDRFILYEANPKCFAVNGAFKAIEARLGNIKALGVDILWIMPIHPIGQKNGVGSPYCVKDFKGINPAYGTLADFKHLVDAAHSKGMKVMLDWIANHTAWDNPWVSEHPDWYTQDASGNIIHPSGTNWNDVADLNYDSNQLRQAMIDALKYWISECDIDGYRCDYAHGVPDDFWKEAILQLKALKGNIVMLAESDYERLFDCGFDIIFARSYKSALVSLFNGKTKPAAFLTNGYLGAIEKVPEDATKLFFITNHDDASENCPVVQFPGADAALAAFVLTASLDCSALIYSSQEIGYNQKINFFNNTVMDWNAASAYTSRYEKAMQAIKKISKNETLNIYASDHVIFVARTGGVVAVNCTATETKVAVPKSFGLSQTSLTLGPYDFSIIEK